MSESSGRVWVRVGFDPLICGFFGFGLFRVRVEKIVFRTQNFRAGSGRVFGSGQFLTGLVIKGVPFEKNNPWEAKVAEDILEAHWLAKKRMSLYSCPLSLC